MLRIALAFPIIWLLFAGYREWSLALFIIAMLTDVLDGWLARKFQWKTHAGHLLDPLADKFVVLFVFIGFVFRNEVPVWGFLIFSRDIGVIARMLINMAKHGGKGMYILDPTSLGKTVTLLETITLIAIYLNFGPKYFLIFTAILSVAAGVQYLTFVPAHRSPKG